MFDTHRSYYRDRGVLYPIAVTAKIRRRTSERLDALAKLNHKRRGEMAREMLEWAVVEFEKDSED